MTRRSDLPLRGLRVGISGAVPERQFWGAVPDLDRVILRFVAQLSGLVLKYGGEVVHGSHPLFTPVIASRAQRVTPRDGRPLLTIVASALWGQPPDVAGRAAPLATVVVTPRIGDGDAADARTRNDSLTALRLVLAHEVDVVVAVGGTLHPETGDDAGVLEELALARWRNVPCFVVAGYGGLAGALHVDLIRELSVDNQMDEATSRALGAWSDEADDHVGRVLEHLVKHRDRLARPKADWPQIYFREATFASKVAEVDRRLVERSARRVQELLEAAQRADSAGVRQILSAPPAGERRTGMDPSSAADDRRKHLELIQAVVNRLASASFQTKSWSVTLTTALLGVIVAAKLPSWMALVGLVPSVLFWYLDTYYLQQERLFRSLYNDAIRVGNSVPLFSMNVEPYTRHEKNRFWSVGFSRSVWLLHACLAAVVIVYAIAGVWFPLPTAAPAVTPAPAR